jgi:hypothetical protein
VQGDWLKASEFLDNNDFDRAGYYIDRVGTHCTGTYISMCSIVLVPMVLSQFSLSHTYQCSSSTW